MTFARGALPLVLTAVLCCWTSPAVASPPPPADLQVVGGADTWHALNQFQLKWTNPTAEGSPLAAAHYRIRDPLGAIVKEAPIGWYSDGFAALVVPKVPGIYHAEVWLENAVGEAGPAAITTLRFDDTRPAPVGFNPIPSWIGRTSFPLRIHLTHPLGPFPLAGIRGYAIAVDATPSSSPCAAADRCTDAETSLRAGVNGDELALAALPEGVYYMHAVAVSGSGMKSAAPGQAVLRVDATDPLTQLHGAPSGWTNRSVELSATATDSGSGMAAKDGGPSPFTAIGIDGAAPVVSPGATVTARVIAEGVHRIVFYARDAAGNVDDGGGANGIANRTPRSTLVRIDRTRPRIAFANSQDPRDPELLRVRVTDTLSGAEPSRGRIGLRRVGSGDRFEALPRLPAEGGELRARWNSDDYPEGEYEFQAIAYDTAGNAAVTTRRANGGVMVLSNPLKATTTLHLGLASDGRLRIVPCGRRVLLKGALVSGADAPLRGMPVRITERFAQGAEPATRTSLMTTGAKGTFSLRTEPGPSRTIIAAFEGSPTLARSAAPPLQLKVRSKVRLHTSSGVAKISGAPLVFRGGIIAPAGALPTRRSVELQFRLPGLPWSEFRTLQTDRNGHFHYAYRFSDDDSRGVRFQFRAYVPAQENWPYEAGTSQPVLVRGR